jgi:hypothetical protein
MTPTPETTKAPEAPKPTLIPLGDAAAVACEGEACLLPEAVE